MIGSFIKKSSRLVDVVMIVRLVALGLCGGTIYVLPFLKYTFYSQMSLNTGLSGEKMGILLSVFGGTSICFGMLGGLILDKISAKWAILGSLLVTAFLDIVYLFVYRSFEFSLVLWSGLSLSTIFLGWPAIMKTVRGVSSRNVTLGYGIYYATNGLSGAALAFAITVIYEKLQHDSAHPDAYAYHWAVGFIAITLVAVALFFAFILRDYDDGHSAHKNSAEKSNAPKQSFFNFSLIKKIVMLPVTWYCGIFTLSTYLLYIGLTFFNPYMSAVFHLDAATSGYLTIIRSFVFMSLTPLTGWIADGILHSVSRWAIATAPIIAITLFVIAFLGNFLGVIGVIIVSLISAFFVCALYAATYSIFSECKFPLYISGTVIGFCSMVSNMADIAGQPILGKLVDSNNFTAIFVILALAACMATWMAHRIRHFSLDRILADFQEVQ